MEQLYRHTLEQLLAPIQGLLKDSNVSEILINGPDTIFVERGGRLTRSPECFESREQLNAAMRNVAQYVGRPFDLAHPALDARLPDGSRVHAVMPPCARNGLSVAIRKFRRESLTWADLQRSGSVTPEMVRCLEDAVGKGRNLLVAGGTGSGKTSLLNVLSSLIPSQDRILVIEDASELQIHKPHVVSFETRAPDRHGRGQVTIRDLFRSAMRMRPDRIVIGELRGEEALDLIQAMISGHRGCMSTLHAHDPYDTLHRLETLALMANVGLPLAALRSQIASGVDLLIQVARSHDGVRRVTAISEVNGLAPEGHYAIRPLCQHPAASH